MKRKFKKVDVELKKYDPPSDGSGGEGEPQESDGTPEQAKDQQQMPGMPGEPAEAMPIPIPIPIPSAMQQLADILEQELELPELEEKFEAPALGTKVGGYHYEELKEKIKIDFIREMIEKLVVDKVKSRKLGRDFYDKRKMARDLLTDAEYKIPSETYSVRKEPMAFYFDFSGSCRRYSGMFAEITAGLIEKGAVTYIGENGYVKLRIDKAPKNVTAEDIKNVFRRRNRGGFKYKEFHNKLLEEVIVEDKITRIVCYTDFDSCDNMVVSSRIADVFWFSAESRIPDFDIHPKSEGKSLRDFSGKYYRARNLDEIREILKNINNPSFEKDERKQQIKRKRNA